MTRDRRFLLIARRVVALVAITWLCPLEARGQTELRPGHPDVDGTLLATGTDSTRVYIVRDGVEREGPLQIQTLSHETVNGEPALVQVLRIVGPRSLTDTTVYRLSSLLPVSHRSHRPGNETLSLSYSAGRVTGELVTAEGDPQPIDREPSAPVFDPGVANLLLRVLPLGEGYEARVPMFDHAQLEERTHVYRVTGQTRVSTGTGEVAAWVVEITLADGRVISNSVAKIDRRVLGSETEFETPSGMARMIVRPLED